MHQPCYPPCPYPQPTKFQQKNSDVDKIEVIYSSWSIRPTHQIEGITSEEKRFIRLALPQCMSRPAILPEIKQWLAHPVDRKLNQKVRRVLWLRYGHSLTRFEAVCQLNCPILWVQWEWSWLHVMKESRHRSRYYTNWPSTGDLSLSTVSRRVVGIVWVPPKKEHFGARQPLHAGEVQTSCDDPVPNQMVLSDLCTSLSVNSFFVRGTTDHDGSGTDGWSGTAAGRELQS